MLKTSLIVKKQLLFVDDHGFSLVNQFYDNVGNLLDDKFKLAYNLTYYT